ncbi:MAG: phenylalanine--tRNA ligase subunit beta [Calditrichaeota bacterium]|nr:phenylalanine--tRNA ligase subunit beta [Calditrichota bacterium]
MKVTYRWLKEFVDFSETPDELAELLTEAGLEVEEVTPLVQPFSGIIVGKVEQVQKHPNADKLSVCQVRTDKGTFQVICGAPNVKEGQFVPFAAVGAELPIGMKIKRAKIRGVESLGMICSKEELGLETHSEGIWAFDRELPLGKDVYELLEADQDWVFDIAVTPNRGDCLSVYGIAREVAALTGNKLKPLNSEVEESLETKIDEIVKIHIHDPEGCPRYAARVIRDVKISPSPDWMQRKLEAVGLRPINNIVDITNYVLVELGHPLHAFDLRQIEGSEIHVRSSEAGDRFVTLDDKERLLPENTVMICDAAKPVAIGGIMGGQNSEVSGQTKDVLLESAYFKPERIAMSSKKLGLSTDASQRFERGADPENVIRALNRAAALMAELAGAKIAKGICDVYPSPLKEKEIPFKADKINRLLGTRFSEELIKEKLTSIQLKVNEGKVIVPTFRHDLSIAEDLAEEVARLVNYSNLPAKDFTTIFYDMPQSDHEKRIQYLRTELLALGLQEIFCQSMVKYEEAEPFAESAPIRIKNPVSDDMACMRPSLFSGMLKAVSYNLNRNNRDLRFFEIGRIFTSFDRENIPTQPYAVAAVITGRRDLPNWNVPEEFVDFYDIKGYLETFLQKLFLDNYKIILYDNARYMAAGESVAVRIDDEIVGVCGRLNPEVCGIFDIERAVYGFELNVDQLQKYMIFDRQFQPIPKFPYSERDIAFLLDEDILAADVVEYVRKNGGSLLKSVEIFDVYQGENIPEGKRSLGLRLRYQSTERTLSDQEVDKYFQQIINKTTKHFSASLRK